MEESPFPDLDIACGDFLDRLEERQSCAKCKKSRKFFCYSCFLPVKATEGRLPRVKLPLKLDVIKHPQENEGKSTSAHAAVIAPDDVTVYTYPNIPDYTDTSRVVLVFPGGNSLTMEQYAAEFSHLIGEQSSVASDCSSSKLGADSLSELERDMNNVTIMERDSGSAEEGVTKSAPAKTCKCGHAKPSNVPVTDRCADVIDGATDSASVQVVPSCDCDNEDKCQDVATYHRAFDRVIFIDSTWYQVRAIYMDERLAKLQRIELKTRTTKFWRHHQNKPSTYLSTIEAIYYFLREYHDLYVGQQYSGEYDNLLFFFLYTYHKIRKRYEGGKGLKAYRERNK